MAINKKITINLKKVLLHIQSPNPIPKTNI
jgi:hypothetical protein